MEQGAWLAKVMLKWQLHDHVFVESKASKTLLKHSSQRPMGIKG